jgi:hypothetical protein
MLNALRDNPLRAPNWRWLRAVHIDGGGPKPSKIVDGAAGFEWIRRVVRLKRRHAMAANNPTALYNLARVDRDMFWAHSIWADEKAPTRWAIEAYILAGATNEEIAAKVGCEPGVIGAYEAVFFDVREKLNNVNYVVNVVMADAVSRGLSERQYDLLWKLFGYQGGSYVLDALIGKFTNIHKPRNAEEVSEFFQNSAINSMRHKAAVAALTVPINTHTQLPLLEAYVKYVEIERTTENAERSQIGIVQNIGAMLTNLPFKIGTKLDSEGEKMVPFDNKAAELRSDELMIVAAGGKLENQQIIADLKFPGE